MDEPVPKRRAEDVEGDQTRVLHVLTRGGSYQRTCGVEEACREVHVVVDQLWHVEAKEVAVEALSEASRLGLDKQGRVDGERRRGSHGGLLDVLCLLALTGLVDFWKCRSVTKRTLRSEKICKYARGWNSSSGGTALSG